MSLSRRPAALPGPCNTSLLRRKSTPVKRPGKHRTLSPGMPGCSGPGETSQFSITLIRHYSLHSSSNSSGRKLSANQPMPGNYSSRSILQDRPCQQHCRDNHWFDGATFPAQLINIATSIAKDGKFVLAGFDEFTPQQKSLVNKLKESGCIVQEHPLQKRNTHTIAQAFTDTREEILAAALWARKQIEADETRNIGIIVHNLQALHSQIENIFDDVLLPGATLVNVETQPRPFSISLGRPLHRYPVIDTAMTILGMGNSSMLMGEFSSLLRSPFIKDVDKESQQRAKLDACLCKYGDYKVSFNTLHWLITNEYIKLQDVPVEFIQACDEYRNIFRSSDKKQSAGEWAKIFSRLLKVFNWPGTRVLNSAEYQTVAEWQNLLNEFASLDLVSRALTYREALTQLRQLVMNTRFQPESQEVPVQILGMDGRSEE